MLKEIKKLISIHESMVVIALKKSDEAKHPDRKMYYWGIHNAEKTIVRDLYNLQQQAEMEVSSIDHSLDALRGL